MADSRKARRAAREQQKAAPKRWIVPAVIAAWALIAVAVFALTGDNKDAQMVAAPTIAPTAEATAAPSASPAPAAGTTSAPTPVPTATPAPTATPLRKAKIRAVGDIMMHDGQLKAHKVDKYDFSTAFVLVADSLRNADYTIGNLEGTIGRIDKRDYSGFPVFNAPPTLLDALKDVGFDMMTVANNHILDRYFEGVKMTNSLLDEKGFARTGANSSAEEKERFLIEDVNGIKIGFLAYTQHTNTMERYIPKESLPYAVNILNKANFKKEIAAIREAGAEFVIVLPHWGEEYRRTPEVYTKNMAQHIIDAGADAILASHPHNVQPITFLKSRESDRWGLVCFSMGNFVATMVDRYADSGIIVEFTIVEQSDGTLAIEDVGYVPTYIWPGAVKNGGRIMRPVPIGKHYKDPPRGMSDTAIATMRRAYWDITKLINKKYAVPLDE